MTPPFIHLRLHTEYSLVDSVIRIPALIGRVRRLRMPAIAVTEQSNLFSMIKFYRRAQREGIKPIIGVDLNLEADPGARRRPKVSLLCQNARGYRNLSKLVTRTYTDGQSDAYPTARWEWLLQHGEGLIVLSGGPHGDVGQALLAGNARAARERAARWREAFPERYYLELQRLGRDSDERCVDASVELAQALDLPAVATNDVRFLDAEDFDAHEARICIQQGRILSDQKRTRDYTAQQYLRSAEEMSELFSDLPEALLNSVHIAERCNLDLEFDRYYLPEFPVPEPGMSVDEWLAREAHSGMQGRLQAASPARAEPPQAYLERLEHELGVITKMGYAGYFLIVADFISWAKENGIPVGPGRGSGAGSVVAYALGITDLDPLEYDLLFERFLNPERVSMPDFDVDFCMDRRDEVIEYVSRRHGRHRVCQIITHGTMAAKAVVRDVGRVLGQVYGFVDQIAKLVPFDLNMTLERALQEEPALKARYEAEEDVRALIDLARKLEGLTRNAGKHAGGVVIAPRDLTEFTPLYCEQASNSPVTQFDMGDVEAIGLVKFDFLGLRTLTIIDWAVRSINDRPEAADAATLDITRIPLDDEATFALVRRAETTAVFQLESRGMRDLIKRLQPDSFDDLVALVALFRPGPLQSGMVDDFIDRKHGRAAVQYLHPELEHILKPTYGVILYQEQVMQIAQVLAGYTLGSADLLRRAMGKKKPEEMAQQRAVFVEGARARGVEEHTATRIFDLMEKFAGYGFNKSHSAAYALIAYQTAWLKAHHPAAFMAAVLSSDMDNSDKVVNLIHDCRRMGIIIRPPDVNSCDYRFSVADLQTIRYGLGAVKGVGRSAVEALVNERHAGGKFADLFDMCRRVDARKANRRVIEALIRAGALDAFGNSRRALMMMLGDALQLAEQHHRNREAGQNDLFGLEDASGPAAGGGPGAALHDYADAGEYAEPERLAGEKEALGLYLSGHPIDRYSAELSALASGPIGELKAGRRRIAGLVVSLRTNNSRRGRIATAVVEDQSGRVDVTIYAELLRQCQELLQKDEVIVVEGTCAVDEFTGENAVTAESILSVHDARESFARRLVVHLDQQRAGNGFIETLEAHIKPELGGRCPVTIEYQQPQALAYIRLGEAWRVHPTDALLDGMRESFGTHAVRLEY